MSKPSTINMSPSAKVSCTTTGNGAVTGWLRQHGSSNDGDAASSWTITDGPNGVITVELANAVATRAYLVPIGRSGSAALFFAAIPLSNTVVQITVYDDAGLAVDLDNALMSIGLIVFDM